MVQLAERAAMSEPEPLSNSQLNNILLEDVDIEKLFVHPVARREQYDRDGYRWEHRIVRVQKHCAKVKRYVGPSVHRVESYSRFKEKHSIRMLVNGTGPKPEPEPPFESVTAWRRTGVHLDFGNGRKVVRP